MNSNFLPEEEVLLDLLKKALHSKELASDFGTDIDWFKLWDIANKHVVAAIVFEILKDNENIPAVLKADFQENATQTVLQSYRLAFLTKTLVDLLNENNIEVLVLKGVCASTFFPVPECRKSGDVDLLVEKDKEDMAAQVLTGAGFKISKEQHANHHTVFENDEHIEVELHTMLVEPFDNEQINSYLAGLRDHMDEHMICTDVMGLKIPSLSSGYFAYQLLLHMLQHFLRAGFGLKLLCDWVVFWESEIADTEKEAYLKLVRESKIKGFSDMITSVCIHYLGLDEDKVSFMFTEGITPKEITEEFLKEILNAEEFGHSSEDRMVVLRGTGIGAYIREFHHQMKLNFPKAGRVFVCWPVTWIITLIRFLINNKKVRNTSFKQILKTVKARSNLMKEVELFEK